MANIELGVRLVEEELNTFKKVIITLNNMLYDKKASIIFGVNEDIRVEVDNSAIEKYEVDKNEFDRIVNNELIPIMLSILQDSEEDFIRIQCRSFRDNNEDKEQEVDHYKDIIFQKIDFIKNTIIDTSLKNRFNIKSTTVHSIISKIEWEINTKVYDSETNKALNSTYTTLKFVLDKKKCENNPLMKFLPLFETQNDDNSILVDCDESDLDYLIKVLGEIKNKLNKME